MYTGKEICQGCGKTGDEINRRSKNELCPNCKKTYDLGKKIDFIETQKYVYVFQHYSAFHPYWLNDHVHSFLNALDNPTANASGDERIKSTFGSNGKTYKINSKLIDPIKHLFIDFEAKAKELEDEKKQMPELINKQMNIERDRIYNEGIKKGRNLLLQLNAGDITTSDLENNYSYNEKK
jgi:hypothetical protein